MAEILLSSGPVIAGELKIGTLVKTKGQPYSPVMTIAAIQRGKPEGSNAVITVATCHWFDREHTLKGLQCEIGALEPYE